MIHPGSLPHALLALALLPLLLHGPAAAQEGTGEARAERLYAEGDLEGAIEIYRRLAGEAPSAPERARLTIAAAWLQDQLGRRDEAVQSMKEALSEDPEYVFEPQLYSRDFLAVYEEALEQIRFERQRELRERLQAAEAALRSGEGERGRRLLEEVLATDPEQPTALYNLARLDLQEGRFDAAFAGFERLLALDPPPPSTLRSQALNNLGLLYYRRGVHDDAVTVLRQAVELDPTNAHAWNNLGLAHRRRGHHEEAIHAFRQARERRPEDPSFVRNLALAHIDAGEWRRALELVEPLAEDEPRDPRLQLALGQARRGLGHLDGAIVAFERAVALDPENRHGAAAAASSHLGLLYSETEDWTRAREAVKRALAWNEEDVDRWIQLGLVQQKSGHLAEARESLETARRLDPTRADIFNNLGSVYFELQDYERAAEAFEAALARQPGLTVARDNLRLARARLTQPAPPPGKAPQSSASASIPPAGAESPRTASSSREASSDREAPSDSGRTGKRKRRRSAENVRVQEGRSPGWALTRARHEASGLDGIRIETVTADGLAAAADLEAGDLVLRLDGEGISDPDELDRRFTNATPGTTLVLDLIRDGRPRRVEVTF